MRLHNTLLLSVAVAALSAAASAAGAQTQTAPSTDAAHASSATTDLADVVVTARRRAENLETVPVSVTAYSQSDLDQRHIVTQVDLANNTPSLIAIQSGYPGEFGGFVVRGQGPSFSGTSGTVTYFAEAPNPYLGIDGRPGSYYDLASIQVLKGPQGTLFGKNATGGNVLFEPQRPTNHYEGYVQGELGNYNDRKAEGAINLPIVSDKVLLRIAGTVEQRDGYTKDVGPYFKGKDYDNVDNYGFRVGLLVRPIAGLESYTVVRYAQSTTNGPGTVPTAIDSTRADLDAVFPTREADFLAQKARGIRNVSYNLNQEDRSYDSQILNSTSYKLTPDLTLKNIISLQRDYISYTYDYDGSALPLAGQSSPAVPTEDFKYFTEELQVQGQALHDRLKYSVGFFTDDLSLARPSVLYAQTYPTTYFLGFDIFASETAHNRSNAGFIQGTYDFADLGSWLKGFTVSAGYRYTEDNISSSTIIFAPPANSGSGKFHYGSYTFDVDYKITPTTMVYASVRDAHRAGGFNSDLPPGSAFASYPPEEVRAEELGVKSTWSLFGIKGRTNLDYFFGDYDNIQRQVIGNFNGVLTQVVESAAQGKINGLELEQILRPLPGLELNFNYAHTTSAYTKVLPIAQGILEGAPFPYLPKNKLALTASYLLPTPATFGDILVSGTVTYQSRQSIAQSNQTFYPYLPGYGQLNLRLDWRHPFGRPFDLAFYGTNVTNQDNVIGEFDGMAAGYGFETRTYAPPRMYGVQLKYSFGGR